MATQSTVTGPIQAPTATTPTRGFIRFQLTDWDAEGGTIITTTKVEAPISNEDFSISLWASSEGDRGTNYKVTAFWYNSTEDKWVQDDMGYCSVGTSGPYALGDILVDDPIYPADIDYATAAALSAAEAEASATAAAASAAAVEYTYQDIDDLQANAISGGDGTIHTTRKEGFSYVEDSGDPDVTFNGVGLGIVPCADGFVYPDQIKNNLTPGTTDMGEAIQSAIDTGYPVGLTGNPYATSQTILLRDDASQSGQVLVGAGREASVIVATATLDQVVYQTDTNLMLQGRLCSFKIDCNSVALIGFEWQRSKGWDVSDISVENMADGGTGILMGKSGVSSVYCYENCLKNVKIDGGFAAQEDGISGDYGLRMIGGATDNKLYSVVTSYVNLRGISNEDGGNNRFFGAHSYGGPEYSFAAEGGASEWIGCIADTPTVAGYLLNGDYVNITGGSVFCNTGSTFYDASAVAFQRMFSRPVTISNVRLAFVDQDFSGGDFGDGTNVYGLVYQSVGTINAPRNFFSDELRISPQSGGGTQLTLSAESGENAYLYFSNEEWKRRWAVFKQDAEETGSNAGSNFRINSYEDDGTYLDTPIEIIRSTSKVIMGAGDVSAEGGAFFVAGTYDKPFRLGTLRMWNNSGTVYVKNGSDPASASDGTILGTQT